MSKMAEILRKATKRNLSAKGKEDSNVSGYVFSEKAHFSPFPVSGHKVNPFAQNWSDYMPPLALNFKGGKVTHLRVPGRQMVLLKYYRRFDAAWRHKFFSPLWNPKVVKVDAQENLVFSKEFTLVQSAWQKHSRARWKKGKR